MQFIAPSPGQHRAISMALMLVALLVLTCGGCSNRAHTDLYQQRMASEIRVLEDQLYDADYQNQVLQQKLEHCEIKIPSGINAPLRSTVPIEVVPALISPAPYGPALPPPIRHESLHGAPLLHPQPDPLTDSKPLGMEYGLETELELPEFDTGTPVAPEALRDPESPSPPTDTDSPQADASSEPDANAKSGANSNPPSKERLLPAPGGPEPPGKRDTEIPKIDPGDVVPPPGKEDGEEQPPGQITLPDSVQAAAGEPSRIRLHPGLSGGYRVDDQIKGMKIVVNVLDKLGKTVQLQDFDIDAELSVVILDPNREGADAKLGRWDFPSRRIASLVQIEPISGFHIPVQWKDRTPTGDKVIVHVRLRAEEDEMRCDGILHVEKAKSIAQWTPRGDKKR